MTRILHVIGELGFDHISAQLVALLGALPREAYSSRVCILGRAGAWANTLRQQGFEVDVPGRGRLFDFSSLAHLRWLVGTLHPDVVHVWGTTALRSLLVAGHKGAVVACPCPDAAAGRSWLSRIDGRLLRRARAVVALGEVEAERCRSVGVRPDQLIVASPTVTPFSVPAEAGVGMPEGTRFLLCVGRLIPQKGFLDAIWALDILRYVHPDLRLLIVGEGPERERLKRFARQLEAEHSVRFTGALSEVASLIERAEVVWSPGRGETGTQVILEAMALGKPVVASRFPRIEELVEDGVTGLLTPAEDKAILARQTQRLLTDPGLRSQLGENARQKVRQQHGPERLAQAFEQLYRG